MPELHAAYVPVHVDRHGCLALMRSGCADATFPTRDDARAWLEAIVRENNPQRLTEIWGAQALGTFGVRLVETWPSGDPKRTILDEDVPCGTSEPDGDDDAEHGSSFVTFSRPKLDAADLPRVLDQAADLTTLPEAGDVWWVDDQDDIRDENRLRVDPHQALRRLRQAQEALVTAQRICERLDGTDYLQDGEAYEIHQASSSEPFNDPERDAHG